MDGMNLVVERQGQQNPPPTIRSNCMNRLVEKLRDPQIARGTKLLCIAAAVTAIFAVGIALHQLFLTILVVGGLAVWAKYEWVQLSIRDLNREVEHIEEERVAERVQAENGEEAAFFRDVKAGFGNEIAWNNLPVLDLGERRGNGPYIDFLRPEDMPYAVMRGVYMNRPFFALKVRRLQPEGNPPYVFAFQKDEHGPLWGWTVVSPVTGEITSQRGGDRHILYALIHRLVVDRNDPVLELIPPWG